MKREIIKIDEEKCTGCGLCIPACPEGALQIIDGKAKLVSETLCDGFGNCVGSCPQDAITIIKREADEFDEADPTVDSSYWTPQRRAALVKELLAGNMTTAAAASEYRLPKGELDKWRERALQGIDEAMGGRPRSARRDPAKVRALARAYKKLKEENRALKSKIGRS